MRVLQLISQTKVGGAESFGHSLCCELARRGHQVLLLANRANGPLFERAHPAGMETRALDRTRRSDPRIVSFLLGAIRDFHPDVIHSHNFGANTWARILARLFPRIRLVCHEHSGLKVRQPARRDTIDRLLYGRASAVFCVSEEVRRVLQDRIGVRGEILHTLPNGIDIGRYARPPDTPVELGEVVCVASLTPVKNHAGLLDVWREVVGAWPGAHLTLVGEGALRGEIEERIRNDRLAGSVSLAGLQADPSPWLWRASIFVMASHHEGLPLALLEAMAAGLACVAPRVGGIPEALDGGRAGRLFPPGGAAELRDAILSLLSSPDERAILAGRARDRVRERYSLAACVDAIEKAYYDARTRIPRSG